MYQVEITSDYLFMSVQTFKFEYADSEQEAIEKAIKISRQNGQSNQRNIVVRETNNSNTIF
jgi:hypothetical protein